MIKTEADQSMLQQVRDLESEIGHLRSRMEDVSTLISREEQAQIEHFQNQLIVQEAQLDTMKHNLKLYGGGEKSQEELIEYASYFKDIVAEFEGFITPYEK